MNTFIVLVVVFIFFKLFQYLLKQSQNNANESSNSPRIKRSPFSQYGDFEESETIESPLGFYAFSVDRRNKEFIFSTEDKTVYRFPYSKLKNYSIKTRNDSVILVELKTFITTKPAIEIECFNKLKALSRLPEQNRSTVGLNILYDREKSKSIRIGEILDEILKDNQGITKEVTPPVYNPHKREVKEEVKSLASTSSSNNVFDILESLKKEKGEEQPETEKREEILLEEIPYVESEKLGKEEIEEIPLEISTDISYEEISEPVVEKDIKVEEVEESPSVDLDNMVRVSISDIEYYSYGKFLEHEVREAVGDAKMKGKKEVFITKEQFDKLKN